MSKQYDEFKAETIKASNIITEAMKLKAVTEEYERGFRDAMWEARETYMRLEDQANA